MPPAPVRCCVTRVTWKYEIVVHPEDFLIRDSCFKLLLYLHACADRLLLNCQLRMVRGTKNEEQADIEVVET
ncbi:hypothetical protein VNO77_24358 [Canavalia gladiata]|uniref:Uncharacterized protein n=1 Tax=Canavalia gladiata TaxID=3824 RepID=A0AAN9QCF5_CANGL